MKLKYDDWYDLNTLTKNIENKTNGTFSINEVIKANAAKNGNAVFLNSFGEKTNYAEGYKKINRIASSLLRMGIQKGDKVSLLCSDSDVFVLSYMAIIASGGVVVTLNTRLATAPVEIEFIVGDSDSKILIVEDKFSSVLCQLRRANLPMLKEIVVVSIGSVPKGTVPWTQLLTGGSEDDVGVKVGGDDQAMQLYTSGTTGRPKGAMLTHMSCLAQMDQVSHMAGYVSSDRVQNMFPFCHCAFIPHSLGPIYGGGSLNIIYPFEAQKCAEFVAEQKSTVLLAVPTMILMLINMPNIKEFDFSSLRQIIYGGAVTPYAAIVKMKELWPGLSLQNIFGMTECSAAISVMKDEDALTKIGGVGRVVPAGTIRVVDENDVDIKPNEVGEIIYKGPNVMKGYYKNPEASANALKDGWYRTGDLGTLDEDGILMIMDRSKDMLIRGGENIYPAEVERVLYEIPAVAECAVIGVPDEKMGERTKVFVVLKAGQSVTPAEVVQHCKKNLAMYKVPEVIEFINEIPKTPLSKINKIALRSYLRDKEWRSWENK